MAIEATIFIVVTISPHPTQSCKMDKQPNFLRCFMTTNYQLSSLKRDLTRTFLEGDLNCPPLYLRATEY